jgi:hypothetical protein
MFDAAAAPHPGRILALAEQVRAETRTATSRLERLAASIAELEQERAQRPGPTAVAASVPAATPVAPASAPPVSDTARIVALDLAATGLSRAEVGMRLERDYGVVNVRAVLDAAFGR